MITERTNFDFLSDEKLLDEIKRLWYEQAAWEYEIRQAGEVPTVADDYMGSEAEEYIDRAEKAYKARGLELPDRLEYLARFEVESSDEEQAE